MTTSGILTLSCPDRPGLVHAMSGFLVDDTTPTRTLILVSKLGHCLNDLLFRARDSGVGP